MATNVLVIGSGAREHALAWRLSDSPRIGALYCAPGNAGTAHLADNIPLDVGNPDAVAQAIESRRVDLTIVGPEAPLAAGLVDALEARGHAVFGPRQAAARIESSKAWAKEIMTEWGVPTGRATICSSLDDAIRAIQETDPPVVLKADGLAAGKGVVVCSTRDEAMTVARTFMEDRSLGEAGSTVLVEEYLSGMEISLMAVTDGETVRPLLPACDYKRVGDGETGPNTGGMGAYAPPGAVDDGMVDQIMETIVQPTLDGLKPHGIDYRGVLYAGLILTDAGPKVLEFNCRFGDPEAQVVLPMLKSDFLELCEATAHGRLHTVPEFQWHDGACVGVVLASGGYPGEYQTGYPIGGLDSVPDGGLIFHAGTSLQDGTVVSSGGRVLTAAGRGRDMAAARDIAYATADAISFEGAYYRRDIASRELG